jgi:hypothetical protein
MNNAVIIQQCLSSGGYTGNWSGIFYDMLRLTQQRHAAYARAHGFDYWCIMGDVHPGKQGGAWDKIALVLDALRRGYEYIVWLDTDAAVMDFEADLRDALPDGACVGAVVHDPARSPFLRQNQVPRHQNVGVLYVRNDPRSVKFFEDWLAAWPGLPGLERWAEQGVFNKLAEDVDFVVGVDDKYNATVEVNMVDHPVVKGWHGVMPPERRLAMMRGELQNDFIFFRV